MSIETSQTERGKELKKKMQNRKEHPKVLKQFQKS